VPVLQGKAVADNDSMVRVDVFKVEGDGYYLVPVYIADTLKDKLPNKAIVQRKSFDQWKEMKNNDFIFSLYPNDLIKVQHDQGIEFTIANEDSDLPKTYRTKEEFVYYKKASISTGSITVINNDNTYMKPSLGVKSLLNIEKYQVDVLGNYSKVHHEIRQAFKFGNK
jgi:CRISPR-associated endonuclease Csn1